MSKLDFVNDFEMNEGSLPESFYRPWLSDKKWYSSEDLDGWDSDEPWGSLEDEDYDNWNGLGEDDEDTCCPCCGCPCSPCFHSYEEDEEEGEDWYSWDDFDDLDDIDETIIGVPVEEVYIDNDLVNPENFYIQGLEEIEGVYYENNCLTYNPFSDVAFKLFSFDIGFKFNQFQYVLKVHKQEIYRAYEMACRIGELHVLEEAVYLFYEAMVLTAGLRYANFLFGNLVKDFPDLMIPVMGKVFRVGGLIYIPVDGEFTQWEIDELLGDCHSSEDSEFYEVGAVSYLMGCFGFDFLKENGDFADYCPLVEMVEGQCENGLLIDTYWLTEALEYDGDLVEEVADLVFAWVDGLCGIESALKAANQLNAVCPLFSDLVEELKEKFFSELD